jgi:hypothetical protein
MPGGCIGERNRLTSERIQHVTRIKGLFAPHD